MKQILNEKEESLEMSKIALTLKQMSNQLIQNKSIAAKEISTFKQELKPSFSEEIYSERQEKSRLIAPKENLSLKKPRREQL